MSVTEEFQQFLRQCTEEQLTILLRGLQARLGTAEEVSGDVDRAAAIMHQLNNLRTIRRFKAEDLTPSSSRDPFPG
jgi:hypothetical protein